MRRALAIIASIAMVCAAAYLTLLNRTPAEFRFTPTYQVAADVGTLVVFAFIAGVLGVLVLVALQAGRRTILAWRLERRQRRSERIDNWEERGERLVWEGRAREGRALLHKAWRRRPANAYPLLALAASYRDAAQPQRARELLTEAAAQHHTNPDVLLALAEAHQAAGDLGASIAVLERVRALHPHAPRVLRVLREAYVKAQRWADAAAQQQVLLEQLTEGADAAAAERDYFTVLRYQAALALPEAAARVRALEPLADARAGAVPILVSLGDALVACSRGDEASVLWERALRTTPRTVFVERLASIATEPRHRDRLRSVLSRLRPDHLDADNLCLVLAHLHLADANADQAARHLEGLRNPAAAPALLHKLWGDIHRRRGQLDDAVRAYAQADGTLHAHHCTLCERSSTEWVGRCPQCGAWDTYRATVEISPRA